MFPYLFRAQAGQIDLSLPTFPFLILAGMALCVFVFAVISPDLRRKPFAFVIFFGVVFLTAAVFAKAGQIIIESLDPVNAGKPWIVIVAGAGATVTAGLIGAILALAVYSRLDPHRIVTWPVLDAFAVSFPFGHMLGRVGCFLNGCCYGAVCDPNNPFGITYPENWNARIGDPNIVLGPRWPSPLFEAAGLAIIGLVLLIVFKKTKSRGQITALYMMLYAVLRFFVEMTRGDAIRGAFDGLSTGQWFSIILFAAGLALLIRYLVQRGKGKTGEPYRTLNGKEVSDKDAFGPQPETSQG